jgi:hypothetical protein
MKQTSVTSASSELIENSSIAGQSLDCLDIFYVTDTQVSNPPLSMSMQHQGLHSSLVSTKTLSAHIIRADYGPSAQQVWLPWDIYKNAEAALWQW